MNKNQLSNSMLAVGPYEQAHDAIISFLRLFLCPHATSTDTQDNTGCMCHICVQLHEQQHRSTLWIAPEKDYVLKDLAPLFHTVSFSLETDELFFFILTHAEKLTPVCANRLLKVLEEPPPGYHFIIQCTNSALLLPTIQSRSTLLFDMSVKDQQFHPLVDFFISADKYDQPLAFDAALKEHDVSASQASTIVQQVAVALRHSGKHRDILREAIVRRPLAGGAKLYLKMLYLEFCLRG